MRLIPRHLNPDKILVNFTTLPYRHIGADSALIKNNRGTMANHANLAEKDPVLMKIKKVTPKFEIVSEANCGVGPCPTIIKTNRKPLECVSGIGCATSKKTTEGTYLIVGAVPAISKLPRSILKKIGPGEMVVEIPAHILPK